MSWKSMSGMLTANHGAIGLRSNVRRLRRRMFVIHFGSPFHHEICSTTPSSMPFSGAKAYSTSSLQPSWYLLRSRSNAMAPSEQTHASDFHLSESSPSSPWRPTSPSPPRKPPPTSGVNASE